MKIERDYIVSDDREFKLHNVEFCPDTAHKVNAKDRLQATFKSDTDDFVRLPLTFLTYEETAGILSSALCDGLCDDEVQSSLPLALAYCVDSMLDRIERLEFALQNKK